MAAAWLAVSACYLLAHHSALAVAEPDGLHASNKDGAYIQPRRLQDNSTLNATDLNTTIDSSYAFLNTSSNSSSNDSKHHITIEDFKDFKDLDTKGKAEIVIVSLIAGLMMATILGCLAAYWWKRVSNIKLRWPAFIRRRLNRDKFSRYEDEAFDRTENF